MMVEMSFYSFCNLQSDFSTFHIYKTDTGNFGFGSGPDLKIILAPSTVSATLNVVSTVYFIYFFILIFFQGE